MSEIKRLRPDEITKAKLLLDYYKELHDFYGYCLPNYRRHGNQRFTITTETEDSDGDGWSKRGAVTIQDREHIVLFIQNEMRLLIEQLQAIGVDTNNLTWTK